MSEIAESMYKRRARVLFVEARPRGLAQTAVMWARQLAQEWVEPRAAAWGVDASGEAPAPGVEHLWPVDAALLAWADLVVPLSADAQARCQVPAGTRLKPWLLELPEEPDAAAWAAASEQLRARVAGLAGGMRMLARGRPPTSGAECAPRPPVAGSHE